jgi:hypothetical protein
VIGIDYVRREAGVKPTTARNRAWLNDQDIDPCNGRRLLWEFLFASRATPVLVKRRPAERGRSSLEQA